MGLFGIMRTGVSGMEAQANKLGTVGDNIANANTTGYKRASTEFSSFIFDGKKGSYNSGGVETSVRYAISDEGIITGTTSVSDLAIRGNGFFVVSDAGGTPFLTRAGSFVPNGDYDLVNAAGFYLMGYPIQNGAPGVIANSLDGLERVNIAAVAYEANPTATGTFKGNLDSNATPIAPGALPSDNVAGSTFSNKSSIVTYDNLGNKVILDVYMANTGPGAWEMSIFAQADAAPGGGFPYGGAGLLSGPTALAFDGFGQLTTAPANVAVPIPGGGTMDFDFADITQVASDYDIKIAVDGNAPSAVETVEFGSDGTVFAIFENGARLATYRIPLATVPSPDQLAPLTGNVYTLSQMSGDVLVGFPENGGFGTIRSGALEQSNVDLASELTSMIESQRTYTANSKVFQTGADLLDVLVNLKR